MKIKYVVDQDNIKLKDYLKLQGVSRNLLKRIRLEDITYVNGNLVKNYILVNCGDIIEIEYNEKLNDDFKTNDIPLDILYEDDYLLIVNKQANIAIQPSKRHQEDNLISSVKRYYLENNIDSNIHIVTRLDFSSSGIVLIAKNGYIHNLLNDAKFEKIYLCKVYGKFDNLEGEYTDPIRRCDPINIKRWVFEDGKKAHTLYKVLENGDISLVEAKLLTGRTHQIRVHFAYHNHPLLGDKIYGNGEGNLFLHCYRLEFMHPISDKMIKIECLPKWINRK